MQLALTPEVLFPLGACAVVAVAVIVVVVVMVRGRRTAGEEMSDPTSADWTGEAATADPVSTQTVPVPAPPQRLTVAEAVAVREADTAPLPISSIALLGTLPVTAPPSTTGPLTAMAPPADGGSTPDGAASDGAAVPTPDAVASEPAAPEPVEAAAEQVERTVQAEPAAQAGPAARGGTAAGDASAPATGSATPTRSSLGVGAEPAGSSPFMAAAVANALAARAAADRQPREPTPVPSRTADARDRLLAVLLADPARAVGAAEELATCRGQLSEVLGRLASSGLSTEQLARLSGFSVEQVTTLLARQGAGR